MSHSSDGKACTSLLGHHSNDGTAGTSRLPIATEGYRPLVQRRIVVVDACKACNRMTRFLLKVRKAINSESKQGRVHAS
jgi:hypothetical protein